MHPRLSCRRCAYPGAAEDMECVVRQTLEVMLWQQWIVFHTGLSHFIILCPLILSAILGVRLSSPPRRSIPQRSEGPNVHFLVKETPNDTRSRNDKRLADWIALREEAGLSGRNGVGRPFCLH
ncbi:hypothetical protein B0H14DRAFT_3487772 [Mycena olivaceomarginata]|nr:hypothetical protein B0H14DRAFT_3487772 [Mycena olivaceomarginata]